MPTPMNWEPSDEMRREATQRHLRREIARFRKENDKVRKLKQLKLQKELELARRRLAALKEKEKYRRTVLNELASQRVHREMANTAKPRARSPPPPPSPPPSKLGAAKLGAANLGAAKPAPPPPPPRGPSTPSPPRGFQRTFTTNNILKQFQKVTKKNGPIG